MRSINLKWLNLTLSNEQNSSSENFSKTPKIKRLEIRGIENRKFWQKCRKFTMELLNMLKKTNFEGFQEFVLSKMLNLRKTEPLKIGQFFTKITDFD